MGSLAEMEARDTVMEMGGGSGSGQWSEVWRRFRRNRAALLGLGMVLVFVFVAVAAPLLAPYGPDEGSASVLQGRCCPGPSASHPLGIDEQGRDVMSRIIFGARYSLVIGIVAVAVGLMVGLIVGAVAGYVGGFIDTVLMRIVDVMLSIPGFLLAIAIVAMLGPGLVQIMIAVGVTSVPVFARLLRGAILAQKENDYVLAASAVGVPGIVVLFGHIMPNAISPVIVQATLQLATAIIDVAGLGFLGLGPQDPSTPEWGTMLTSTVRYLQSAPHLAIFPGVAIVFSVLGFNLIGDGLREALDPKLRGR